MINSHQIGLQCLAHKSSWCFGPRNGFAKPLEPSKKWGKLPLDLEEMMQRQCVFSMFFFPHGCQKVMWISWETAPVAPKISAIPAIEVLGKPVSCRRITWKKGDLNLQSLPQQKSRRCFYVGYFCRRILGVFPWFLGRKSERDMEVPWSWSSWFGLAIGGDWTRFGNLWLLECLAFWSCYLVPSTWFTCLVEVLLLLL